jgi:hypothetical protein
MYDIVDDCKVYLSMHEEDMLTAPVLAASSASDMVLKQQRMLITLLCRLRNQAEQVRPRPRVLLATLTRVAGLPPSPLTFTVLQPGLAAVCLHLLAQQGAHYLKAGNLAAGLAAGAGVLVSVSHQQQQSGQEHHAAALGGSIQAQWVASLAKACTAAAAQLTQAVSAVCAVESHEKPQDSVAGHQVEAHSKVGPGQHVTSTDPGAAMHMAIHVLDQLEAHGYSAALDVQAGQLNLGDSTAGSLEGGHQQQGLLLPQLLGSTLPALVVSPHRLDLLNRWGRYAGSHP